ncbi:MAG: nucleoside deaminase [Phycisphaerae bacterium]
MIDHEKLMRAAIDICIEGIGRGQSPFAAVIATTGGHVVHAAYNTVRLNCDPTAHAEVNAIRGACHRLGIIDLSNHVIAATCEPCPMCAAAIHWAGIDTLLYGATIADAQDAGFNELSFSCRTLYATGQSRVTIHDGVLATECKSLFRRWHTGPNPTPY